MTGEVWVYRNLRHGRKTPALYSVMAKGKVVDRVNRIMLSNARFVVREAGRLRALAEGRKNVHAFVVGTPVDAQGAFGTDADDPKGLPAKLTYRPQDGSSFLWDGRPVTGARAVLLNEDGVSAAYLD